jgi:hypothetical protein
MSRDCRAKLSEQPGRIVSCNDKTQIEKSKSRNKKVKNQQAASRRGNHAKDQAESEFLARRGFWFFFPEKKNTNTHGR